MTKIFEFEQVGTLGSSRGVDGGIKFIGKEEVFAHLIQSKYIFVKRKDGNPVPYLIEGADFKGNYILLLEGVQTPEEAKVLTGCEVLVEKKDFEESLKGKMEESTLEYSYLKDFLLKDKTSGLRSRIKEIESYPQQEMAILETDHLVPLHEDFILHVDKESREVQMELPEGLFDE